MPSQLNSRIGGILAALVLIALVLVGLGAGYEEMQRRRDAERFPRIGRAVDIGGRTLNIFCSGEGSPTVIFESDALTPGYGWVYIQREVARITRACWYDRAGYGWSDPGPTPHTSALNVSDLHELLRLDGVPPPYLLVGDGFGTLDVRVYAGLRPGEVAGTVLVDPILEFGEEQMGMAARIPFHLGFPSAGILQAVSRVGLIRLAPRPRRWGAKAKGLTPEEQEMLYGLEGLPKMRAALLAEEGFSRSLNEVRAIDAPRQIPSITVKAEDARFASPDAVVESVRTLLAELRRK